jgi:hypothetical protein
MPQLGEPFVWGNPWEGTEFDELIQKTKENREMIEELEKIVGALKYDFETFAKDSIRTVEKIYKNLNEMQ